MPFFEAGLRNNEYCMWIVSEPVSTLEAADLLKKTISDFEYYLPQVEILLHKEWYLKYGDFQGHEVIKGWINKIKYALSKGYDGIRICGSTTWIDKRYWKEFIKYEAEVEREIASLKMIALCPYQLDKCGMNDIIEIANNHQFSFMKSKYDWKYTNNVARLENINLVGKIAASIAHEIRNPMTSVRGFIQLLQMKNDLREYNDYFTLIINEIDRANGIIEEYLSLVRNEGKNLQKHTLNEP